MTANPITPTEIPAFCTGEREELAAAALVEVGSPEEVLVPVACVVVPATDVINVVSVAEDVVNVKVCVSTTNVEGRPVLVDLVRVFAGEGYEIGPPPEGGTTRVAVITP